jgi:hypothetical protein
VAKQVKPLYLVGAIIVIAVIVCGALLSSKHQDPQNVTVAMRSRTSPNVKAVPTFEPTTPEGAMDSYITALQRGDQDVAQQIYNRKDFQLNKSVPIKSYQIYKRVNVNDALVKEWAVKRTIAVRAGDVELRVRETYQAGPLPYPDEQTESFSYFLRHANGKWTIYAHSL